MTGSQSFNLMKLAGESLAGRAAVLHLSGLAQNEIFAKESPEKFEKRDISDEIKKSYSVNKSMVKSFDVLKKAELELGTGAIICLQEEVGALDSETLLIPAGII